MFLDVACKFILKIGPTEQLEQNFLRHHRRMTTKYWMDNLDT
jgi:hypothetical protein